MFGLEKRRGVALVSTQQWASTTLSLAMEIGQRASLCEALFQIMSLSCFLASSHSETSPPFRLQQGFHFPPLGR